MENIKQYYLLCTVKNGGKMHLVEELPPGKLEVVFLKKEVQLYFRQLAGKYIIRESIVGGRNIHTGERQKILVIT